MRPLLVTLTLAALLGATAAQAERRVFIIASSSDGYGVDHCLADGASCGAAAAAAYCKQREYAQALSYRKVERDEITGAVPSNNSACRGANCDEFVAIVCSR